MNLLENTLRMQQIMGTSGTKLKGSVSVADSSSSRAFYCAVMRSLERNDVPFLVGGAYALTAYTGITRKTKDLDIFVSPHDHERALGVLSEAGCRTELTFPHWLGKAYGPRDCVDIIFGSGNGIAIVDDAWFEHARQAPVLGSSRPLVPPEEMIWSKAFVMERERFDGADIAHLISSQGHRLDWPRLLDRFGEHWRVLLSHLILFGFIYPDERRKARAWIMDTLARPAAGRWATWPAAYPWPLSGHLALAGAVPSRRGCGSVRGRAASAVRRADRGGDCHLDRRHRPRASPRGASASDRQPCS